MGISKNTWYHVPRNGYIVPGSEKWHGSTSFISTSVCLNKPFLKIRIPGTFRQVCHESGEAVCGSIP
jgi:hypothetical protein